MLHLLWTVLIGFFAGMVAKWIHPGKENMGFIVTALLGIAGSLIATYGGQFLHVYQAGEGAGFIGAVIGAIILLFIYGFFVSRGRGAATG
jgi:uncharacterized membrane protein YeaQ/YmgE (transglycosylase-associated protein family)